METKNLSAVTAAALLVMGCTTPMTMLKDEKTGQVVNCGGSATGSMVGGVIGYHIQKSNDADCVAGYMDQGFKRVSTTSGAEYERPPIDTKKGGVRPRN